MRRLAFVPLVLAFASSAQGQVEEGSQPSQSRRWAVGATLGVWSPHGFNGLYGAQPTGAGGFFVESRALGQRLGVRAEYLYSGEFTRDLPSAVSSCLDCTTTIRRAERVALVAVSWEFRQRARIRPYTLLGAGMSFARDREVVRRACADGSSCPTNREVGTSTNLWEQPTLSFGAGTAFHLGNVAPFVETRLGAGSRLFSVGMRVRAP